MRTVGMGPRLAAVIFGLLVVATFGAFFVAQRLKNTPTALQRVRAEPLFSPNAGGAAATMKRVARFSFIAKTADDYSVEVIDRDGDVVRTLARDVSSPKYRQLPTMIWDGRTDAGRLAPDGKYRYRVTLRNEGRSIIAPKSSTLDATPPKPRILAIGPEEGPGPELLPNGRSRVTIHLQSPGRAAQVLIFRTSPGAPRQVTTLRVAPGRTSVAWNGRVNGARVAPGSYLAVARWRDKAGNLGTSVPLDAKGVPVIGYGETLPGHGGITVRYLEIQPPTAAVAAGDIVKVGVDARGECFSWTLRPIGGRVIRRSARPSCHGLYRLRVPAGSSRVYLFEARTPTRSATVPIAVQGKDRRPVLVVLPLITWQGRNAIDDDGDGAADTLDRGVGVNPARVLASGKLPVGFSDAEAPLLAFLMNKGRRFDVTTDYALAHGRGPRLADYRGVILPGDVRWLPGRVGLGLRRWVRSGGRLLSIGLDSLRRDVSISARDRLVRPTAASETDLFGARISPLVRRSTTVTADVDTLRLFSGDVLGGTGLFPAPDGYEPTAALGPSETMAADAVTPESRPVIVAARFGDGLVIRIGMARFADHLNSDNNSAQLVLRAWRLLARR